MLDETTTGPIHVRHTITAPRIEEMKSRLALFLPRVGASHRIEALARGLGFRTWAAANTWVASNTQDARTIEPDAFTAFLVSRGHDASGMAFECALATTAPRMDGSISTLEQGVATLAADTWAEFDGYPEFAELSSRRLAYVRAAISRKDDDDRIRSGKRLAELAETIGEPALALRMRDVTARLEYHVEAMDGFRTMMRRGQMFDIAQIRKSLAASDPENADAMPKP